jgi:hypothetical protein
LITAADDLSPNLFAGARDPDERHDGSFSTWFGLVGSLLCPRLVLWIQRVLRRALAEVLIGRASSPLDGPVSPLLFRSEVEQIQAVKALSGSKIIESEPALSLMGFFKGSSVP